MLAQGVSMYFVNTVEFVEAIEGLCAPKSVGSQLSKARDGSKNVIQPHDYRCTTSHHLLVITDGSLND